MARVGWYLAHDPQITPQRCVGQIVHCAVDIRLNARSGISVIGIMLFSTNQESVNPGIPKNTPRRLETK
eukprot:4344079-Amphidinium_carterae.1